MKLVEAAVRTRRSAVGGSQSAAPKKVLQGNTGHLSDELFPVVSQPNERWQLLAGVHVTLDRHSPDFSQYLMGIVLGVEWQQAGPTLRIVLTAPALGRLAGNAVTVAALRWRISPSPADVAATASRETHCEAGRPLYREDEFPPDTLATLPTLTLMRLRPTVLQAPVASLLDRSGNAAALYAIVDAEQIPTAPRNAAANARRRICSTCGATSPTPFPATRDGKRHCPVHIDSAKQQVRNAEKARNRAVSALWAREVIDDPDTILVAMTAPARRALAVRVETLSGDVLLDNFIDEVLRTHGYGLTSDPDIGELPDWAVGPHAHALAGRRAVGIATDSAAYYYDQLLTASNVKHEVFKLDERRGDNLSDRHRIWKGESDPKYLYEHDQAFRSRQGGWHDPDPQPVAVLQEVRAALSLMALTSLTSAQEEYADRLLHNVNADEYKRYHYPRRPQSAAVTQRLAEAVELFGS